MDATMLSTLKQNLLDEETRLIRELAQVTEGKKSTSEATVDAALPQYGSKDDENAAEVATYSDRLSLEQRIEPALADIRKALARMERGEYGKCKYCGQAIDDRRLMARPESSSCITCKEAIKGA